MLSSFADERFRLESFLLRRFMIATPRSLGAGNCTSIGDVMEIVRKTSHITPPAAQRNGARQDKNFKIFSGLAVKFEEPPTNDGKKCRADFFCCCVLTLTTNTSMVRKFGASYICGLKDAGAFV